MALDVPKRWHLSPRVTAGAGTMLQLLLLRPFLWGASAGNIHKPLLRHISCPVVGYVHRQVWWSNRMKNTSKKHPKPPELSLFSSQGSDQAVDTKNLAHHQETWSQRRPWGATALRLEIQTHPGTLSGGHRVIQKTFHFILQILQSHICLLQNHYADKDSGWTWLPWGRSASELFFAFCRNGCRPKKPHQVFV